MKDSKVMKKTKRQKDQLAPCVQVQANQKEHWRKDFWFYNNTVTF